MSLDNYGYFGPDYSVADNILLPGEIGVRQESSFEAIFDAVGGVNYYIDEMVFGGRTLFDTQDLQPAGIRYFLNTEMRCSNGATMSEYMDGVTRGDLLGDKVKDALASAGLPGLKGMAPGILENARDALDPRPLFDAVTASSYPVCQQVQCPVGDSYGSIRNAYATKSKNSYIVDPVTYDGNGMPVQTRWVQAYDGDGDRISVTKDEFGASPKCYNADGSYMKTPPAGCPPTAPTAITATASGTKYALCTQVQPPTPPSFSESFSGDNGLTGNGLTGNGLTGNGLTGNGLTGRVSMTETAVAIIAVGAIGLLSFFRFR